MIVKNNSTLNNEWLRVPYIAWEISNACNLGCQFCYSSSWNKKHWQNDKNILQLSIDEIKSGLDNLVNLNLGIKYISWTGGEIMLRNRELKEILEHSTSLGFQNILTTNGMFTPVFKDRRIFKEYLLSIKDNIDWIALSLDGEDEESNNLMRLDLKGNSSKHHFKDVISTLELIKELNSPFKIKINTVVTSKNKDKIVGILKLIKEYDCVWKIVQFNPRECPKEYRNSYNISKEEFINVVEEVKRQKEILYANNKIKIGQRTYNGNNEPYGMFIINSNGDILLPSGEDHLLLGNIYDKDITNKSILSILSNHLTISNSYKKARNLNGKLDINTYFYRANLQIFNEGYELNNIHNKTTQLNRLINIERALLANITDWHEKEFCDVVDKSSYDRLFKEFDNILIDQELNLLHVRLLFSQKKVKEMLYKKWGVIGGQTIILNNHNKEGKRVYPFIDRSPEGLEIPLCLNYDNLKGINYFRTFFNPQDNSNESRKLPLELLKKVINDVVKPNYRKEYICRVINVLKGKDDETDDIFIKIFNLIMLGCVETTTEYHIEETEDLKEDPLFGIFYEDKKKNVLLSKIEKELDVLLIPPEEAALAIYYNLDKNIKSNDFFDNITINKLINWIKYQNRENNINGDLTVLNYKCHNCNMVYDCNLDCYRNTFTNASKERVYSKFWDFLFSPMFNYNYKCSDLLTKMPVVLYIPFDGSKDIVNDFISTGIIYIRNNLFKEFWVDQKEWNEDILIEELKTYIFNLSNFISPIVYHNTSLEMQTELKKEKESVRKFAIRSAVAAVMSRNMSHNIGSHSLNCFSMRKGISDISNYNERDDFSYQQLRYNDIKPNEDEYYKEGRFAIYNSYLKTRMDMLADLATSVPIVENSKYLFKEVIRDFDKNVLLLNTISGVKDFKYELILKKNRNNFKFKGEKSENDSIVAMPNGILGNHTLYVILENIIRNCAKHGGSYINNKPTITIEIRDSEENADLIPIFIYDNKQEKSIKEIQQIQNSYIDLDILDDKTERATNNISETQIRKEAWGILEMKVCASYLRKIPIEKIDEEYHKIVKDKCNIIESIVIDEENKIGLGYKIFLMKPKEILIWDFNNHLSIDKDKEILLRNNGVLVLNGKNINLKKIYPHQLLLIIDDVDEEHLLEEIKANSAGLPSRILIYTTKKCNINYIKDITSDNLKVIKNIINNITLKDIPCLMNYIWSIWYNHIKKSFGNKNISCNDFPNMTSTNGKNNSVFEVVFDDHGTKWEQYKVCNPKTVYYEPIGTQNRITHTLRLLSDVESEKDKQSLSRIYETIFTKIGVVDERIQKASQDLKYKGSIPFTDIYEKTRVIMPKIEPIDLNKRNFKENFNGKSIKSFLEEWFELNTNDMDFLLIHLSIIEKLITGKDKSSYKIEKYIKDFIVKDNQRIKVILISGRGKPHNIPSNYAFINYSNAAQYFLESREKYLLTELVYSARKPK